jgi:hypothetical protein
VVDFKKLAQSANNLVNKRGGMKSVQEDANELLDIAKGQGSLSDKAKRGAEALKDPGAPPDVPSAESQPGQSPENRTGG